MDRQFYRLVKVPLIIEPGVTTTAVATEIEEDDVGGTWLFVDGSELPIDSFSELFDVMRWEHGGTEKTFNLPPALPGEFTKLIKARSGTDPVPIGIMVQYAGGSANKMQA